VGKLRLASAPGKIAPDHLFQLVSKAYENVASRGTSNLDFSDWGTLFTSPGTAALPDRLLPHARVITLRGDSYRVPICPVLPRPTDEKEG
jgi:DNA replication protein DnaC